MRVSFSARSLRVDRWKVGDRIRGRELLLLRELRHLVVEEALGSVTLARWNWRSFTTSGPARGGRVARGVVARRRGSAAREARRSRSRRSRCAAFGSSRPAAGSRGRSARRRARRRARSAPRPIGDGARAAAFDVGQARSRPRRAAASRSIVTGRSSLVWLPPKPPRQDQSRALMRRKPSPSAAPSAFGSSARVRLRSAPASPPRAGSRGTPRARPRDRRRRARTRRRAPAGPSARPRPRSRRRARLRRPPASARRDQHRRLALGAEEGEPRRHRRQHQQDDRASRVRSRPPPSIERAQSSVRIDGASRGTRCSPPSRTDRGDACPGCAAS